MKPSLTRLWALGSRLPAPVRRRLRSAPGLSRLRRMAMNRPSGPSPAPGSLRPVVYLPTWARWDTMRQRPQYLLAAFARAGHPVFFVDPREPAPRTADGVDIVPDLSTVPAVSPILYVHFAPLVDAIDLFTGPAVIYDVLDDLSIYHADEDGLPEVRTVAHHHPRMMEAATVVTFSAPVLAERYDDGSGRSLLVANGVEVERFSTRRARPTDLPTPDGALIGYHGAIAPWLDFDLVDDLASRHSGDRIVLVGPVLAGAEGGAARLARRRNVTLVPERGPDQIAAYVQAFDVGIIPFLVDDMTAGVSPLKMYEYLAAGVPVVATPLPACEDEPLVVTAGDADAFAAAAAEAIGRRHSPDFAAAAAAAADAASWDRRVAMIRRALEARGALTVGR